MKRLTVMVTSFITISLILKLSISAKIDPDSAMGIWLFDKKGDVAKDVSPNGNDGDVYASGRNQIANPSFESDKDNWGSGGGTWDIVTDEKYHGSKSSRFKTLQEIVVMNTLVLFLCL